MSLAIIGEWLGGIILGNWYLERLSISHFTTSTCITEYWQGMMSDLIDFLFLNRLRTYWCPHHYEFRNESGVAWWYNHLQLVSGAVEYITLCYKYFHHCVFAGNDVTFDRFPVLETV